MTRSCCLTWPGPGPGFCPLRSDNSDMIRHEAGQEMFGFIFLSPGHDIAESRYEPTKNIELFKCSSGTNEL